MFLFRLKKKEEFPNFAIFSLYVLFCHFRSLDICFYCCVFRLDKQIYVEYCFYLIQVKHPRFSYASGRHRALLTTECFM